MPATASAAGSAASPTAVSGQPAADGDGLADSLGILSVSMSILLMELLLTRVFSVVMYHHFSFLAVSLAMTGLGLGGLVVNLAPGAFRRDNVTTLAPLLALALPAAMIGATRLAFSTPVRMQDTAENWRSVVTILAATLVPFTLGGVVIAHILTYGEERMHRLYFADLLGAALACLLMVPLAGWLGAPGSILFAAAIGALGGGALATGRTLRIVCIGVFVVLAACALINTRRPFFDVGFAKGGAPGPTLVSRWNSFSRVEVRGTPADLERMRPPVSWGFTSRLRTSVRELHLLYDADAMTQIVGFDGDLTKVKYLLYDVTAAPHHVRVNPSVLVIGAGGGRDILAALAAGSRAVTGVEINDITVDIMREQFRDYTHGLYDGYPGVAIVNEDGRSFVRRTGQKYDLIMASLVDTWAASAAGAYALAENSLYTVEAFGDYLARLQPDGMISFSRWYDDPPMEVLRVVALARRALEAEGVRNPAAHIAIVRTDARVTRRPSLATILIKRSPFSTTELESLQKWANEMVFDIPLQPGQQAAGSAGFASLLGSRQDAENFASSASFDLSVTTDDRPFFFDRVPVVDWLRHRAGLPAPSHARGELPLGSRTLLIALVVTAVNALLLCFLPLLGRLGARRKLDPIPQPAVWIAYFACLGLGYIVVEIVLIQRFNLLLGKPGYALSVVLFTMLVSSALGSLAIERAGDGAGLLVGTLAGVCALLIVLAVLINPIIGQVGSAAEWVRIATAAVTVAIPAFVMGMPFPTGLRRAARLSPRLVSWAWAVNGGLSVLGSVMAVLTSMTWGFSTALMLGIAAYVSALLLALLLQRRAAAAGIASTDRVEPGTAKGLRPDR
ncbi:MAG TPA: hypothetical protein VEL28_04885 [Candidatus Binatia bacterium]|nr:hypothetical protein [Candidatus Binatia bacterium]